MKEKNLNSYSMLIFIIAAFAFILGTLIFLFFYFQPERIVLPVTYMLGNTTGIDLNNSLLTYGRIVPGNSATRIVSLYNPHSYSVEVVLLVSDNLLDIVKLDVPKLLESNSTISFPVSLQIPRGTSYGNYSGTLIFELTPIQKR